MLTRERYGVMLYLVSRVKELLHFDIHYARTRHTTRTIATNNTTTPFVHNTRCIMGTFVSVRPMVVNTMGIMGNMTTTMITIVTTTATTIAIAAKTTVTPVTTMTTETTCNSTATQAKDLLCTSPLDRNAQIGTVTTITVHIQRCTPT